MKTVLQNPNYPKGCTICCVSMLTEITPDRLIIDHGTDYTSKGEQYWSMTRAFKALAANNWFGISFNFDDPIQFDKITPEKVQFDHLPALVGVKSTSLRLPNGERADHCVVYDQKIESIRDPNHEEPQPLSKYDFVSWVPLTLWLPYEGEFL